MILHSWMTDCVCSNTNTRHRIILPFPSTDRYTKQFRKYEHTRSWSVSYSFSLGNLLLLSAKSIMFLYRLFTISIVICSFVPVVYSYYYYCKNTWIYVYFWLLCLDDMKIYLMSNNLKSNSKTFRDLPDFFTIKTRMSPIIMLKTSLSNLFSFFHRSFSEFVNFQNYILWHFV